MTKSIKRKSEKYTNVVFGTCSWLVSYSIIIDIIKRMYQNYSLFKIILINDTGINITKNVQLKKTKN